MKLIGDMRKYMEMYCKCLVFAKDPCRQPGRHGVLARSAQKAHMGIRGLKMLLIDY